MNITGCRLNYLIDKYTKYHFHFVLGNSSCDLDSVVSSIFLAFYKNIKCGFISFDRDIQISYNIKKQSDNDENFVNDIYIPVINCKKDEFFWRLDIAELLKTMKLSNDDFYYFSDIFNQKSDDFLFKELISKLFSYIKFAIYIKILSLNTNTQYTS